MNFLTNLLYPKSSFIHKIAGKYIDAYEFQKFLPKNIEQKCHVCGRKCIHGMVHSDCREQSYIDGIMHVTFYNNLAKDLIKFGKYEYFYSVFEDIGLIMAEFYQKFYSFKNPLLVPIPLHKSKFKKRGFNQAEIIANVISRQLKIEAKNLLIRQTSTDTQAGKHYIERKNNLINIFKTDGEVTNYLERDIILVDDVLTSGATLEECAKTLKSVGAKKVFGFAFAKARAAF